MTEKHKRPNKLAEIASEYYNTPIEAITWQQNLIYEYQYIKEKYNKLHKTIIKYEAKNHEIKPCCSFELLKRQAKAMGEYLYVLELRAEIEGIELE